MADTYTPVDGLKNAVSFPTEPVDEAAARKQIQDMFDQTLAFHNAHMADNTAHGIASHMADNTAHGIASHTADNTAHGIAAHVADYTAHGEIANVYRSGKDANGVFVTLEYKRTDGTLFKKSVLSGGISPKYTTRTVTYYDTNGTTVLLTKVYTLTYTGADLTSEVTA